MASMTDRIALLIEAKDAGAARVFTAVGKSAETAQKKTTQLGAATDTTAKKTKGLAAAFGVTAETLKAGLVAGVTSFITSGLVEYLSSATEHYLEAAQGAAVLANATNSTVNEVSKFAQVAERAGLDTNDLTEIFADFQQAAAKGRSELAQLGVQFAKNKDGTVDWTKTLVSFLDQTNKVGDATERNRLLFKYLGEEGAKQVQRLLAQGKSLSQAMSEVTGLNEKDVKNAQQLQQALNDLRSSATDLGNTIAQTLVPVLTDMATLAEPVANNLSKLSDVVDKSGFGIKGLAGIIGQFSPVVGAVVPLLADQAAKTKETGSAAKDTIGPLKDQEAATTAAAKAADDAAKALEKQNAALYANLDANLAASGSEIAFEKSVHDLTGSVKDNGRALSGNTEKALNNRDALLRAVQAAEAHAQAVFKQTGSVEKGNAAFRAEATALYDAAIKAGFSKGEVDKYITSLGLIPPTVGTDVYLDTDEAYQQARNLRNYIDGLSAGIDVYVQGRGNAFPGMMSGGPVAGGTPYIVGERGPELFVPNTSGTIIPNHQLTRNMTLNVTVNATGPQAGADAGRQIVEAIRNYERRNGSGWRN